jgi:hypothetical protein
MFWIWNLYPATLPIKSEIFKKDIFRYRINLDAKILNSFSLKKKMSWWSDPIKQKWNKIRKMKQDTYLKK